eukprot:gene1459-4618_t
MNGPDDNVDDQHQPHGSASKKRLIDMEDILYDPAPLKRKWAFAVGAFGSMATHTAVGFFLSPFLLEIATVQPYIVSIITLLGRVWDAITDPLDDIGPCSKRSCILVNLDCSRDM